MWYFQKLHGMLDLKSRFQKHHGTVDLNMILFQNPYGTGDLEAPKKALVPRRPERIPEVSGGLRRNRRTPEAQREAPEAPSEAPEARSEAPEARSEAPEARSEAPEARSEAPEDRSEAPEAQKEEPEGRRHSGGKSFGRGCETRM